MIRRRDPRILDKERGRASRHGASKRKVGLTGVSNFRRWNLRIFLGKVDGGATMARLARLLTTVSFPDVVARILTAVSNGIGLAGLEIIAEIYLRVRV